MAERAVLLIDLITYEARPMSVADAAEQAQLLEEEVAWALDEFGKSTTARYMIIELDDELPAFRNSEDRVNACFLLEIGDSPIGYFRSRSNALRRAHELASIQVVELSPPERIACEDDVGR